MPEKREGEWFKDKNGIIWMCADNEWVKLGNTQQLKVYRRRRRVEWA